jgi:AraC-like DNA-binding protein
VNDLLLVGSQIGAVSQYVHAENHQHWMMQFFMASHGDVSVTINGEVIKSNAIIVNMNTMHRFYTADVIHFTLLIDPTSTLGRVLRTHYLKGKNFYELPKVLVKELQLQLSAVLARLPATSKDYFTIIKTLVSHFEMNNALVYDQRVNVVLRLIEEIEENKLEQVKEIAKHLFLSESRLSHLFKSETGMSLKSYLLLSKMLKVYECVFEGMNITNAAIASGFDSSAHFAMTHKKMTGMSTREVIKDSRFLKVSIE